MAAYTGTWLKKPRTGRQDANETAIGKVSWTAALTTADTLTIANLVPFDENVIVDEVIIYGTLPDTNATPTTAFKAGTAADDDAFLVSTVVAPKSQVNLRGNGAAIASTVITGAADLIITPTANAATAATTGDLWVVVTFRQRN